MSSILRFCLIISLAAACSCGWHLRGNLTNSATTELFLISPSPYAELVIALKENMQQRAIKNRADSNLRLSIGQEDLSKRTVAVTNIGSPSQYELSLSVDYHYTSAHQTEPTLPQTISVQRVFDFDPSNTVAKSEEESTLLDEMRRELANRILQQASKLTRR